VKTIDSVGISVYEIPVERPPETDGSAEWSATTMVLVTVAAGGRRGIGWTYGSRAVATLILDRLAGMLRGRDAREGRALWTELVAAVRNDGRRGLASYAIAALDVALWDLRARLLDVALCDLFGLVRTAVPIYGSGGFTSYDIPTLQRQLGGWASDGFRAVKMKVGRDPSADPARVAAARSAVGPDVALFVDVNGGYDVGDAIRLAHTFAAQDVRWFEQPVDPDDLDGTRRVRAHAPAGMDISTGEYLTDTADAAARASVCDVLQADATRCGGYTGLLAIDGFCDVIRKPLSTHCSPMLHLHVAAAALRLRHLEWFVDHVRIERMFFDGFVEPNRGALHPDRSRPGHGLALKESDARPYLREHHER
jgi:L-alanine-DL-glutamate epimerase-like enolase superfamily enzyme